MGDHAVLGPDAEPFDVPVAHEALHDLDAGEAVVFSQSVHQVLHLDYRRQVAQQYATGTQRAPGALDYVPRLGKVEQDPIHIGLLQMKGDIFDLEGPM